MAIDAKLDCDKLEKNDAEFYKKITEITSDFLPSATKPTPVKNFYIYDKTKESFVAPLEEKESIIFVPHTIEDLTKHDTLVSLAKDEMKEKADAVILYSLFHEGIIKPTNDLTKTTFKDIYIKDKEEKKYYAFESKEGKALLPDGIVIKSSVARAFKTTEKSCEFLNKQRESLLKILKIDEESSKEEKKDKKKKDKKEKKKEKKEKKEKKDKKKEKRKRDDSDKEEEEKEAPKKKVKLDVAPPPAPKVINDKTEIKTTSKKAKQPDVMVEEDDHKQNYIVMNQWLKDALIASGQL